MTKAELYELLKRIDRQYWGKIGNMISDTAFLDAWYEDMAGYDNELITDLYRKYDDPNFPPTAKYFTINAEKELKELDTFYLECANEIFYFATESVAEIRAFIREYESKVPYNKRREVMESAVKRFRQENIEEKASFKGWLK